MATLAIVASACSAPSTSQSVPAVPSGFGQQSARAASAVQPAADGTSILKMLTTQTVVGSTVDPKNGDTAPYGLVYENKVPLVSGIVKKGDLVVCNYANAAGTFGAGTTEEVLGSKVGSKPVELIQSSNLLGCSGLGLDVDLGDVYSSDATAKNVVEVTAKGKIFQTIAGTMTQPFGGTYVSIGVEYPPGDGYWTGDATTGTLWRIDLGTSASKPPITGVVTGFKVNKGKPGTVLGPTAIAFNSTTDTLYVVDGASNILYAFSDAYDALDQSKAVVIGPTGKTFTGPAAKNAKVLYSGGALSSPIAMCMLPNGNLIVADAKDNNLVEIESTGAVLATKNIGKGAGGAVHGVVAVGSSDANTVLYFANVNENNVQLLGR